MKNKFCSKFFFKSTFYLFFSILTFVSFISCENFLNGAETAKELNKLVSYANAPVCSVLLKSDESMGTFIAGDSKEFKVGYETEIYFSANIEACILSDLTAQFATDSSKDISEYISIKILERDDEKGLYKISVKVLKEAPDIIIKPVCLPYPAVESYSPKSDGEPDYANKPIKIIFNMPMEAANITPLQSLFNYSNISITYDGQNLAEYFNEPYFNEEKNLLTLAPKPSFLQFLKDTREVYITVNVDFSSDIFVKSAEKKLFLRQNEKAHFTVRYKAETEDVAPVKTGFGFFASVNDYSLQELSSMTTEELAGLKKFNQENIAIKGDISLEAYSKKIIQNRFKNDIYLYGRYYDEGSGVNRIIVDVEHTNSKDGLLLKNQFLEPVDFFVEEKAEEADFYKDNNYVLFKLKYTIPQNQNDNNDGAYGFNVTTYDACENPSLPESFTAIKDTGVNLNTLTLFNLYNNLDTNSVNLSTLEDKLVEALNAGTYNESIKTIQFLYAKHVYASVEATGLVDAFVKYINKDGNEVTEAMAVDSANPKLFKHTLDVNHVHDSKITIIIKDNLENSQSRDFYFPTQPKVLNNQSTHYTKKDNATLGFSVMFNKYGSGQYTKDVHFDFSTVTESYNVGEPSVEYYEDHPDVYFFYANDLLFSEGNEDPAWPLADPCDLYNWNQELEFPLALTQEDITYNYDITDDGEFYKLTIGLPQDLKTRLGDKYDMYDSLALGMCIDAPVLLLVFDKDSEQISLVDKIYSQVQSLNLMKGPFFITGIKDGNMVRIQSNIENKDDFYMDQGFNLTFSDDDTAALRARALECRVPLNNGFNYGSNILQEKVGYHQVNEYIFLDNAEGKMDSFQVTVNNAYRYSFDSSYLGQTNASFLIDAGTGNYFIPLLDLNYGETVIDVNLINKAGSSALGQSFTIEKSPIVFEIPETLPVETDVTLTSLPTAYNIDTAGPMEDLPYDFGSYIYIAALGLNGWENLYKIDTQDENFVKTSSQDSQKPYLYSIKNLTLPKDKYIKISTSLGYNTRTGSQVFYNGAAGQKASADTLIDMESFYFVSSSQPVYIYTLASMKPLSECSSWTADEWDALRFKANEQFLDFSPDNNGNLRIYTPDTTWMQEGFCYVTIARFADGHAIVSKVREK